MTYKYKQGNSIWLQLDAEVATIDSTWDNWTGSYAVVDANGVIKLAGALEKDTTVVGRFFVHINGIECATLTPADYALTTEIKNTVVGYTQENADDKLIILPQKIL